MFSSGICARAAFKRSIGRHFATSDLLALASSQASRGPAMFEPEPGRAVTTA